MVVRAGLKLKKKDCLKGRCDSFVVETNVHYSTDINLLFDAMRKTCTDGGLCPDDSAEWMATKKI